MSRDNYFLHNGIVCEEAECDEIQNGLRTLRNTKAPGAGNVPVGTQRIISLILLVWDKKDKEW